MQEFRKFILDKFQEHLQQNFLVFCERHALEKNDDHFITFLIDQNLISRPHLQRYTILNEFEKICHEKGFPKTIIVDTLANRFSISERTVWTILKHTKTASKPSKP